VPSWPPAPTSASPAHNQADHDPEIMIDAVSPRSHHDL